jgi:uncharacterized protein (DUF302 family)
VADTLQRLDSLLAQKGIHIFARIDHAAGAQKVGLTLRPTQVLIFGNPQVGTALMQSQQSIGLDLPLRVLAWEDADGRTWLTYHDPADLAARYQITDSEDTIRAMRGALEALTKAAAAM